jgi:hypothetical protein
MTSKQYKLNLPKEVDDWIEKQAAESLRSKSAEIIFHLRAVMEKEKAGSPLTA